MYSPDYIIYQPGSPYIGQDSSVGQEAFQYQCRQEAFSYQEKGLLVVSGPPISIRASHILVK